MKKWLFRILIGIISLGLVLAVSPDDIRLQAQDDSEFTYYGTVDAPEFPEGLDWINVSTPLTIEDLRGKIVLLDFWTYGCINCIHIIPDLKRLEAEYGEQLVVIGVHSAKFENEGQTENIRQIVQRYGVEHPVVNDADFVVWQTYGVQAWPTLYLIDPLGKVVGRNAGEGVYLLFQPIIDTMTREFGDAGLIDTTPLEQIASELALRTPTALKYPGKVLADSAGNRLIISDSSHHRVIVTALDTPGDVQIIGSGEEGFVDGTFETAQFNNPQGLALEGDILYIADTENHAIRRVDLSGGTVKTLAGTGNQSGVYPPEAGIAPNLPLSSPWDLTLHNNVLYIAMAGPHQLWRIDLATGETRPHAGNAREDIIDGTLEDAQLAQPSGIDTDGELLYFADAESSSIRTANLGEDGEVRTIVGTGLFDFGDVDGVGDEVRLQHALGVTVGEDGLLYVTDTYNNKIKVINPVTRESSTFAGNGTPGLVDGALAEARFYEPGGLDYANGKLYIADTNNHAVRIIDLATASVSTVQWTDVSALLPEGAPVNPLDTPNILETLPGDNVVTLAPQSVLPGEGTIVFDLVMPEGYKFNNLAPFTAITASTAAITVPEASQNFQQIEPPLPVTIPVAFNEGFDQLSTDVTIYWCEAVNESLCFVERVTFKVPILVDGSATETRVVLPYTLVPPVIDGGLK